MIWRPPQLRGGWWSEKAMSMRALSKWSFLKAMSMRALLKWSSRKVSCHKLETPSVQKYGTLLSSITRYEHLPLHICWPDSFLNSLMPMGSYAGSPACPSCLENFHSTEIK